MTTESDFYDTPEAGQLAQAYQNHISQDKHSDWLFLICLFLALYV